MAICKRKAHLANEPSLAKVELAPPAVMAETPSPESASNPPTPKVKPVATAKKPKATEEPEQEANDVPAKKEVDFDVYNYTTYGF